MNRLCQAVVMLLFGGVIVRSCVTDVYLRYVKEGLRPFLLAAGLMLIAAAVMGIVHEVRRPGSEHSESDADAHSHHEPSVGWLLLLPVVGLALIAPPALGAYAADQNGTVAAPAADAAYPPLPPGDPVPVGLLDYASRSLFDQGRSLTGRTVQLTGFVAAGPDGTPMLARIVLTCCAADGRPIKIGLTGPVTVDATAGSWVEVTGTYSPHTTQDPINRADIAYLEVRAWQPTTPPRRPYA